MDDVGDDGLKQTLALSLEAFKQEQHTHSSTHNLFEDIFSDLREETFDQEERVPREFQQELINTVLKDKHNYIVFAPTGCGKTFIASKVAKHFLEEKESKGEKATVLFMVDRIPLVLQQADAIKSDIGNRWNITKYCGELGGIENWKMTIGMSHVLVLTAQILVNCLSVNPGALSDVDLLIFDECHHTTKEHPFHKLVKDHWKVLPPNKRPKILGLTASPGGNVDLAKTETKIHNLCENMHSKIIMVKENVEELKSILSTPKVELIEVVLDQYLVKLVDHLTKLICKKEENAKTEHGFRYVWPENKTSFEYMRFCEKVLRDNAYSRPVRSACGLNLTIANCIQLLEDVGLESVINYLTVIQRDTEWPRETSTLLREFKARLSPNLTHGKRDTLMKKLKLLAGDKGFKRGIIFVKTRASAYAILEIVEKLSGFKPCILVGHGSGSDDGMKVKTQKISVKQFNDGIKNLMIATSVAEEGLDIQACNTVIRYDALNTAEALIQSRGRARFHDSSFVVLLSCNSDERTKFYHALESEKNMHLVVKKVQERPGSFYDFLYKAEQQYSHNSRHSNTSQTTNTQTQLTAATRNTDGEIVKFYSSRSRRDPEYKLTETPRGFVGEATIHLDCAGTTATTNEVYAATEGEVRILLDKAIVKLLFEFGELEGILDIQNLHLSPSPSPIISSAIPRTIQPQLTSHLSNNTSYPGTNASYSGNYTSYPGTNTSYPGNFVPPTRAIMPSNNATSAATHSITTHQVPSAAAIDRVGRALNMKGKTPIQYLFEWCQDKKHPQPSKTCNTVGPFACTIHIANVIQYTGPKAQSKKDAEHKAATDVLALLDVF